MEQGTLFVKIESAREALPVQGRVVISQTVNGVRVLEIELVTDEDGLTQPSRWTHRTDPSRWTRPAPSKPGPPMTWRHMPTATPTFFWRAYRYIPAWRRTRPSACFLFFLPGGFAHSRHGGHRFHLPQGPAGHPAHHHPRARHPRRLRQRPRAALHLCHAASGAAKRIHPQYITVHLGKPQNSAANETVSFPYYIKNVCSSEIYPPGPKMPSVPTSTPRSLWR